MRTSALPFAVFRILILPAIVATVLLYLYPAIQNCSFPGQPAKTNVSRGQENGHEVRRSAAPFRLLALGDPQLEGDTSIPDPNAPAFPSLSRLGADLAANHYGRGPTIIKETFQDVGSKDIPNLIWAYRKRLDLWGNDFYLAHIHRLVSWWTQPTHTVVLGDLLGSQWISDAEFDRRADRFWGRVFKGMQKVEDEIMDPRSTFEAGDSEPDGDERFAQRNADSDTVGSEEFKAWEKRLITVAGNHDIGYAGDINNQRIERFERTFGRVNWNLRFRLPWSESEEGATHGTANTKAPPEIELIILNDMNLDGPAWQKEQHEKSWEFLDGVIEQAKTGSEHATILLTHIPLYKEAGVCVDAPYFDFFPQNQGGGIQEQNHLTFDTSQKILSGLFGGLDTRGVILNGHDHEGCDSYHLQSSETEDQQRWNATQYKHSRQWRDDGERHGIREITVRSMMGSFGGNAGLLSAWFDQEEGTWKFEYDTCVLGVQHIWWAVHILDFVVMLLGLASLLAFAYDVFNPGHSKMHKNLERYVGEDKKTR